MSDVQPLPKACGGPSLTELRRFDTGELTGDARALIVSHTASCVRCEGVLREFAADRAALNTILPFPALERRLVGKPGVVARMWRRVAVGLLVPATVAAGVPLIAPRFLKEPGTTNPFIRTKGGPSLDFVVKSGSGTHDGRDGESLRAGDALMFRYGTAGMPYVLIVGVDADGKVTPYLSAGDRSTAAPSELALAPNSVVLDGDPRPERVFAIYSKDPIGVDEVKPSVHDGLTAADGHIDRLSTLPGFESQASILLNKSR